MAKKEHALDLHRRGKFDASRGSIPESQRLGKNVADLFLSGDIPAKRARTLFEDAQAAQATGVDRTQVSEGSNVHRDLVRKLKKGSKWPPVYMADIPCNDPASSEERTMQLAFLLPHELMAAMLKWNSGPEARNQLLNWRSNLRPDLARPFQQTLRSLEEQQAVQDDCLPLGLWIDGVPVKFDRSESLECYSLSFPTLNDDPAASHIRLPLTVLNKKFYLKDGRTNTAIISVLSWSLHCCISGIFPAVDHLGQPWVKGWRRKQAMTSLGASGLLREIRGDWMMYKGTFHLPSWQEHNTRCCWKCTRMLAEIREVGEDAPWKRRPSTHEDLINFMLDKVGSYNISPLTSLPGISANSFAIDWLHTADQGVGADFLGNVTYLLATKHFPGNTLEERVANVFSDIKSWYQRVGCENRYNAMTVTMVRAKPGKSPKLKGKAGEIRHLIPWGEDVMTRFFAHKDASSEEGTCREAAAAIHQCYKCLARDGFHHEALKSACRKFLLLYAALEACTPIEEARWRLKPKFHLFLHVCEETSSSPSGFWTYVDETWGGKIAHISVRRGGLHAPRAQSQNVLQKFCAQNKIPER